ncbi:alanyl-tRNA editing protein [Roseisolibacter agri]|uniref:Alanyl-tRNA editing protein n=1 Tax=Roseisolibacter agri TaxID=2014610 RepID=A0AA37V2Q0_9BACT|nr:alanyl-tRNA editing protein [Roseisolibacter agri]GLC25557.1 alanyl-tRNA editing protein [Roseisolibacter agri]
MTTRLYYTDASLLSFTARVAELADDGRRVYLDRTALYPTSGGQPHDLGALAGVPVVDVVDEDDRVAHVLAAPLSAAVGDEVAGTVDAARRLDHRQQHTGQHLLSAVFADLFGHETLSVHFGAESSTLDLGAERVPREALLAAEARANALVAENRPVQVTFEDAAAATGLRKPSGRTGTIRIVEIAGVDRSACGGTHMDATGGIGAVLLRRVERVRQATRVEFLCGLRAVRRARADYDALSAVAAGFSTAVDEAPAAVRAQGEQLRAARDRVELLGESLAAHEARAHWDAAVPDADGVRRVVRWADDGAGVESLTALARAITALPRTLFVGAARTPAAALLVATSADSDRDANALLRAALAAHGGRGGGSARLAQGRLPDIGALERAVDAIK